MLDTAGFGPLQIFPGQYKRYTGWTGILKLTSFGFSRGKYTDGSYQTTCDLTFEPDFRRVGPDFALLLTAELEQFRHNQSEGKAATSCPNKLTLVSLLGDEIQKVNSECSVPERIPPKVYVYEINSNSTVKLFVRAQNSELVKEPDQRAWSKFRFVFTLNVRGSSKIRAWCTPLNNNAEFPTHKDMRPRITKRLYTPGDKRTITTNQLMLLSPGYPRFTRLERLTCKLTFEPANGLYDADTTFQIWVERLETTPACGYKLFFVNMLGDTLETEDHCGNIYAQSPSNNTLTEFSARGRPRERNGSVQIVLENVKEEASGKFAVKVLVVKEKGGAKSPRGHVHASCVTSGWNSAESWNADNVIPSGLIRSASGDDSSAADGPAWVAVGSGVAVGAMAVLGIVVLYVVWHRKQEDSSKNVPISAAKESPSTLEPAT